MNVIVFLLWHDYPKIPTGFKEGDRFTYITNMRAIRQLWCRLIMVTYVWRDCMEARAIETHISFR